MLAEKSDDVQKKHSVTSVNSYRTHPTGNKEQLFSPSLLLLPQENGKTDEYILIKKHSITIF